MRERGEAAAAHDADRGQDETAAGRHNLLLCRSGEKEEITAWLFRVKSAIYTQFGLSWTLKIMKLSHFIHTYRVTHLVSENFPNDLVTTVLAASGPLL